MNDQMYSDGAPFPGPQYQRANRPQQTYYRSSNQGYPPMDQNPGNFRPLQAPPPQHYDPSYRMQNPGYVPQEPQYQDHHLAENHHQPQYQNPGYAGKQLPGGDRGGGVNGEMMDQGQQQHYYNQDGEFVEESYEVDQGTVAPIHRPHLEEQKPFRPSHLYNIGYDYEYQVDFSGCDHWKGYKMGVPEWTEVVRLLTGYSMSISSEKPKTQQFPIPLCSTCCKTSSRITACLKCVFLGCWGVREYHILDHFHMTGHFLGVDLSRMKLFCFHCKDYIYDREFETVVREEKMNYRDYFLQLSAPNPRRAQFIDWKPYTSQNLEMQIIEKNTRSITSHGLRGLYNLGSTCFMNCVLQSLIHNPLIRSYYLSDLHSPRECPRKWAQPPTSPCLSCEMDGLFSKCFSGETNPIAPQNFLYSMWTYSQELAGYEQQDAHEFFISLLNGIHTHNGGVPSQCECIIHQTFTGILKSDVKCENCKNVSSETKSATNDFDDFLSNENPNTLEACLSRFTSAEKLVNQDFRCGNCNSSACEKQLSLKVTPCVLSVHLKRFEHTMTASNKIDTYIEFPLKLDLAPYLSSAENDNYFEINNHEYSLFAVISHIGTLESGHYVCFVRSKGEWFKIDDSLVTKSSAKEVLQCKGYMLYYVKNFLDYVVQP